MPYSNCVHAVEVQFMTVATATLRPTCGGTDKHTFAHYHSVAHEIFKQRQLTACCGEDLSKTFPDEALPSSLLRADTSCSTC